ncbi:MAG TPA: copper resistance protein B [Allosphingosinicella sp.]|jgi:copper resistance protein B|uniref:copper resistance protein B n=1 Tax=Allosphingosinicella sp. TaxID=2823234 RepID=UPI002F2A9B0B
MMRLLIALAAASALTAPALAQHHGHHGGHTMPMPKAKPAPKKPAPAKPAARKTTAKRPAAKKAVAKPGAAAKAPARKKAQPKRATPATARAKPRPADPHAGHKAAQEPVADPHAGHDMPASTQPDPHAGHQAQTADPHTGHDMEAKPDAHAGHDMGQADVHAGHEAGAPTPPNAPPPPAALSGPAHAADGLFGAERMAAAREGIRAEHGDHRVGKLLVDRLEARIRDGRDGYAWDGQGWYGGDIDKLWVKTEGEGAVGGAVEQAEVQALWSHAIGPFFDLQAGARYDLRPRPDRAHLVLGVQGLAPYWFEVDAAAFLSAKGDLTARVEAEYDQRVTQKLILQPRVEFDLAAQDVPELGIGSGLSTAELGLRLRYEFKPQLAPYVGVEYERAFGGTADFRRAKGEDAGGWSFLVGLRAWF